jgi:cyclic beta-1,2-glucan synthetase
MYQAAIEALLGLRRHGATFSINPCIPARWPTYSLEWKHGRTLYRITVMNPDHRCCGVGSAEVDGAAADARVIPLVDDGRTHDVLVILGDAVALSLRTAPAVVKRERTS